MRKTFIKTYPIVLKDGVPPISQWVTDVHTIGVHDYLELNGARFVSFDTNKHGVIWLFVDLIDVEPRLEIGVLKFQRPADYGWVGKKYQLAEQDLNVVSAAFLTVVVNEEEFETGLKLRLAEEREIYIVSAAFAVHVAIFGSKMIKDDADAQFDLSEYSERHLRSA